MATVTKGRTFVSGEVVTPAKLNTLVDSATVTQIVDADISATAAIADTKLAPISSANKVSNSATTATSANTASAIVARDASGNFSAGTITASSFNGNGSALTGITTIPPGAIMPFAMNVVPSGWLAANGAAVSRATYSALFAALGTFYGSGDGSTTFTLPDLRGLFLRALDNGRGVDPGRSNGSFQNHGIADHSHRWTFRNDGGVFAGGGGYLGNPGSGIPADFYMTPGTAANETRPTNIAMLYCIKF